jgi:hypothetical protein
MDRPFVAPNKVETSVSLETFMATTVEIEVTIVWANMIYRKYVIHVFPKHMRYRVPSDYYIRVREEHVEA